MKSPDGNSLTTQGSSSIGKEVEIKGSNMDIIRALLFCLLKIIASKERGRILGIPQDGSSNTTYGKCCLYKEVT